ATWTVGHVANRVDVHNKRDEGLHHQHQHRQSFDDEADLEAPPAAGQKFVDTAIKRIPRQHIRKDPAGSQEGNQDRENRHSVSAGAAKQAGNDGPRQRRERREQVEGLHPLSESRSSTSIVFRFLNRTTRIARPIADSAAATERMKNTNTGPATSPRKYEKAMKFRLTASSISSIAISRMMMLRRFMKMPTTLMAKSSAPSTR